MTGRSTLQSGGRVALTGATGFIGTSLCRRLLDAGFTLRALVRDPDKACELAALGVQLIPGDLENQASLQALLAGTEALVHGAGAVRGNSQWDFDRVNVEGTKILLRAMADVAPEARLVHLSSIVARQPDLSWYSSSKRRGEDLLSTTKLNWVALRPPAVYGPGDREMLPIFQTMKRGFVTVPGSKLARTSLVHVEDLCTAIQACLASPQAHGQIFELGDGRENGYNWAEMASIAGEVFGRRVRLWELPAWLLNGVAAGNSALARLTGNAPMLTPPKLRELRHPDWVTDNGPITAATGWTPQIQLREGLTQLGL